MPSPIDAALVVAHEHALWAALEGQRPCEVLRALGYIRTDLPSWQDAVEGLAMRAMRLWRENARGGALERRSGAEAVQEPKTDSAQ